MIATDLKLKISILGIAGDMILDISYKLGKMFKDYLAFL